MYKHQKLFPYFGLICIFILGIQSSCTRVVPVSAEVKKQRIESKLNDIAISFSYHENKDTAYQAYVSDAIDSAIMQFNTEKHHFKVHKKNEGDSTFLHIQVNRVKFANTPKLIAGYVAFTTTLAATLVMFVTSLNSVYIIPTTDKIKWEWAKSNDLKTKLIILPNKKARSNALFHGITRRKENLKIAMWEQVYELLKKIEKLGYKE